MKRTIFLLALFVLLGYNGFAQCDPDVTPPTAVCVGELSRDVPQTFPISIPATDFNAGSFDGCNPSNTLGYFVEFAPQSATPPSTTALTVDASLVGDHTVVLWVVDAAGNSATCTSTLHLATCQPANALVCNDHVVVTLGPDLTYDFTAFDILEGGPYCDFNLYNVQVDNSGFHPTIHLTTNDIGIHQVSVQGIGAICWGGLTVLPGPLNTECPQLIADLATPSIRPCFPGYYRVFYMNGSTLTVPDTYVDVTLDEALTYESSSIPGVDLGNNVYRFQTGELTAGENGIFAIYFTTDCDAVLGATFCAEAQIYPSTLCDGNAPWQGPIIAVNGHCTNDSIYFEVKNIGNQPTTGIIDYVVVEDVLMLQGNQLLLQPLETYKLAPIFGTGATYRLEATQDQTYPFGGNPAVTVEGCNGLTPGLVNILPLENSNPAIASYCRESTASLDPNDKQAQPKGYGVEHLIEHNVPIEYMIRFQNTGTDTAFNVVLVDTLSAFLDAASVRPGAASHPYHFEVNGHVLKVKFDNILLPNASVNEPASNGFVQFTVQQKPDLVDGTVIENRASIYFDFNAPIVTNTVFHTLGSHFIEVSVATHESESGLPILEAYPNPTADILHFNAKSAVNEVLVFALTDVLGRVVQRQNDVTLPMTFERGALESGTYFFQFTGKDGRLLWNGKILVK